MDRAKKKKKKPEDSKTRNTRLDGIIDTVNPGVSNPGQLSVPSQLSVRPEGGDE
jgi:hypothetical protein